MVVAVVHDVLLRLVSSSVLDRTPEIAPTLFFSMKTKLKVFLVPFC